jgi:hypothetical protein
MLKGKGLQIAQLVERKKVLDDTRGVLDERGAIFES